MPDSRKLPRKWRLFNRAVLALVVLACIVECSRCAFGAEDGGKGNEALERERAEAVAPLERTADSGDTPKPDEEKSKESNLDHVYAQRDTGLARTMDTYLRRFHPDYALYLAVDAKTNEILAWGERKDSAVWAKPDFMSRATFPAASLAKTVTLAAALESKRFTTSSEIPLIGRAHTLYKRQLRVPENYRGAKTSLETAYAKSYNPPIALVGMDLGKERLLKTAQKFGFNREFPRKVPEKSLYAPPDSSYGIAEVACGFTQGTTLSPLHAAAIVRSVVTHLPLEIPWERNGASGFAPKAPETLGLEKFSDATCGGVRKAMLATAKEGTSRKYMNTRFISKRFFSDLDIGGKTGSLDGEDPKGRYDWFMGFAQSRKNPDKAIILVIMQIHGEMRTQVASQVAALLINYWAKETLHD